MNLDAFCVAIKQRFDLGAVHPEDFLVSDLKLDSLGAVELEVIAYENGSDRSLPEDMPYEDIRVQDAFYYLFDLQN